MTYLTKTKGFTLIEVMVALFILSLVLGSAVQMVHQYSDERLRIRERFFANQVAWNHLFERYQHSQKWTASAGLSNLKTKGVDKQAGQDWRWEIKVERLWGKTCIAIKPSLVPLIVKITRPPWLFTWLKIRC